MSTLLQGAVFEAKQIAIQLDEVRRIFAGQDDLNSVVICQQIRERLRIIHLLVNASDKKSIESDHEISELKSVFASRDIEIQALTAVVESQYELLQTLLNSTEEQREQLRLALLNLEIGQIESQVVQVRRMVGSVSDDGVEIDFSEELAALYRRADEILKETGGH